MHLYLEICQQSRPWECGNPEGISKECGKGGKPASWLSMLSILCHFHGLLLKRASQKSQPPRRPASGNRNHSSEMPTTRQVHECWASTTVDATRTAMRISEDEQTYKVFDWYCVHMRIDRALR